MFKNFYYFPPLAQEFVFNLLHCHVFIHAVDEMADPETWEGEWVEKRWTPLSRAIDRGLDSIVMLFRDALNAGKHAQHAPQQQQGQGRMPASAATSKNLVPQGQPPINAHNEQFMQGSPAGGPSTSSNEGAARIAGGRQHKCASVCYVYLEKDQHFVKILT